MKALPAMCGGKPIFEDKINIVRPVLPEFNELEDGIHSILDSRMVTKGRFLRQFEEAVAQHLGVRHAVAVSSCTTGLMLTFKGLQLTGEVVVPSFTFMATISALCWCGLRPVFVDVDAGTTNMDPAAAEKAITPQTSAILAVHNFGNPAAIAELREIADRHGLKLIFDAAHGFGTLYQGKPLGEKADANIYSLSPTKLLITGEGGIVATNNDNLAESVKIGREYGNDGNYDSLVAGLNARMSEFNALMGLHSLEKLEEAAESRNTTAALYQEMLGTMPGIDFQKVLPGNRNSYKDFSITIDELKFGLSRDDLANALAAENIDTRKYYDPPTHRHTAYQHLYDGRPLPNTEWLAQNSLSLPIWSNMEPDIAMGICKAIQRIYENRQEIRRILNG